MVARVANLEGGILGNPSLEADVPALYVGDGQVRIVGVHGARLASGQRICRRARTGVNRQIGLAEQNAAGSAEIGRIGVAGSDGGAVSEALVVITVGHELT